ncbi:MAG: tetratricopeptide repeat protein [Flavobacterium sp.]|nr:MAG: tetratricopeptide repeat protein [Flavobacterium sp.]
MTLNELPFVYFYTDKSIQMSFRRQLAFFLLLLSFNANAQKTENLLKKAFISADSSAYYFNKAKKTIRSDEDIAEYYFCKNAWHSDKGNLDSTIYYGNKASQKFIKLKSWLKLMYVYNNMGKAYNPAGEYEKAISAYFKGLKIAEQQHDLFWKGNFYQAIATSYHDFEDFEKGIYYGKKALKTFMSQTPQEPSNIAGALNITAINFDDWNKPDSALAYHYRVFDYVKGKDTIYLASTYNNIGNTLLKQKKYREARRWIETSARISEINKSTTIEKNYWYDRTTNYNNLAVIAFNLGDFAKADKYFEISRDAAVKSQNVEKLRDYYYGQYLFNKKRNNLAKAIDFQEHYIQLRDSVFDFQRAKTLASLETKYQSEKREKELLKSKADVLLARENLTQKNTQMLIISLVAITLAVIGWLVYRQQKLRNRQIVQQHELQTAIAGIEAQHELQNQRIRISRDLHDNIGAQLTFIISAVENLKYVFELKDTKLDRRLDSISNFARDTIVELRDTIWAMNHSEISFEDLRARILNFIEKAKSASESINFDFSIDEKLSAIKLTSIQGMNVYRTIQEAVNNALKHAGATQISIVIESSDSVRIKITDNGFGFDKLSAAKGNGISNMEKRISDIGGEISIASGNGKGTEISIMLPSLKTAVI